MLPQLAYKHMGDCRLVLLVSADRSMVATANNQSSILACEGLGQGLALVTQIVDHMEATCHRPAVAATGGTAGGALAGR